jgi:hypothetical protein
VCRRACAATEAFLSPFCLWTPNRRPPTRHAVRIPPGTWRPSSRAGAAIEWSRTSLQWAERAGARSLQASAWVVLAEASAESDQPVGALAAVARALALVDDAIPGPRWRSVYTGIAITFTALGLPRHALAAAQRAFAAEAALGPASTCCASAGTG